MSGTGYRTSRTAARPAGAAAPSRRRRALAAAGFVLVALNMRAALSAVSPLVREIEQRFGLPPAAGGLLTTLPVLAMAAGAPFVPRLARRFGVERSVLGALALLVAGIAVRALPSAAALFAGCVLAGLAITVLNVLMPGIVKRDFPDRVGVMTGVYTTVMIGGSAAAAAASVPLERALGGIAGSLGCWALLALVALVGWLPRTRQAAAARSAAPAAPPPAGALWRSPLAWQIALFMGVSSLLVYTAIAWLPTILAEHGMSHEQSGSVFAFSTFVQIFTAFAVPAAAGRVSDQRLLAVVMVGCNAAGFAGLLVDPVGGAWAWAVLLGIAQGGSFGLALTMLVLRAGDAATASQLSGMAQLVGYLIAAAGPVGAGLLRQAGGSWTLPLVLLLAACAVGLAAGLGAGRNVKIRQPHDEPAVV